MKGERHNGPFEYVNASNSSLSFYLLANDNSTTSLKKWGNSFSCIIIEMMIAIICKSETEKKPWVNYPLETTHEWDDICLCWAYRLLHINLYVLNQHIVEYTQIQASGVHIIHVIIFILATLFINRNERCSNSANSVNWVMWLTNIWGQLQMFCMFLFILGLILWNLTMV